MVEGAIAGKHVQRLSKGAAAALQHGKSDVGKRKPRPMLRSGLEMEADAWAIGPALINDCSSPSRWDCSG